MLPVSVACVVPVGDAVPAMTVVPPVAPTIVLVSVVKVEKVLESLVTTT